MSVDSENLEQINAFIEQYKIDYLVLLAVSGSALSKQKAVPMSLLIDKKSFLAKKYVGAVSEKILRKDIEKMTNGLSAGKKKQKARLDDFAYERQERKVKRSYQWDWYLNK